MIEQMLQEMKELYYASQKFVTNIKVGKEGYTITSNQTKSIEYLKKLFYPNGVNGIYIENEITKINEKKIECIHIVNKDDFLKLVDKIHSTWKYEGKVYPVKEGYYDSYENNGEKCFLQDYKDDTSGEHIIFEKDGSYTIISLDSKYEFMILGRFVREIAFRYLEDEQYVSFHSSSVEINGKGYLIIGDSGAGKSTMALTLCKYFGASYISNDRIMVKIENGEILAIPFGMPIKVNYGTLKTLGVEDEYEQWNNIIPMVSKKEFFAYKGEHKLNLLAEELKEFLGIESGSKMKVSGIIMPSISNVSKEGKKKSSIEEILERNCYYDREPVFIEDWLKLKKNSWNFTKEEMVKHFLQLPIYKEEFEITEFKECAQRIINTIGLE